MTEPVFTIGHSTRPIGEFVQVLTDAGIERVVDVRRLRGSTRFPQFDAPALSESLDQAGISLESAAALTGRRPVSHTVPFEVNAWWTNRSFHNYADHALGEQFRDGLRELHARARGERVAVMCAEAVWWRCHRRIIADYLLVAGTPVQHLLGPDRAEPARLSAGAVVGTDGTITYPGSGEP